ncbi:hypothetical protein IV203_015683 [Nitzschia inconspicua]|uniref:Uncharacterized protein n=1 Tax=Nitzschia inconspicua TaxID=303405 RepID=A0A9K3LCB3_9STRA|nr:hypothetical protein IV203_015683 [Nitzschia inconspicua]
MIDRQVLRHFIVFTVSVIFCYLVLEMTKFNKEVTFSKRKPTVIRPLLVDDARNDDDGIVEHQMKVEASNPDMLPKHRERKLYLLKLSYIPVAICVIAFARSAFYRLIRYHPDNCRRFGWYTSSSGEFTCDHKPLDFHAKFALLWLTIFAIQVGLLTVGGKIASYHKYFGRLGMIGAFGNAGGMFWLAIYDLLYPMKDTDRPSDFTPFMFLVAVKLTLCLFFSLHALLQKPQRDIEQHMIWMFRGFITSFTTPVIRFYPMVLRKIAGKECFDMHRDKMVMGAMFVSELCSVVIYYMAQKKTQTKFWDTFMKLQVLTFAFVTLKELVFAAKHGTFISGMAQCTLDRLCDSYSMYTSA